MGQDYDAAEADPGWPAGLPLAEAIAALEACGSHRALARFRDDALATTAQILSLRMRSGDDSPTLAMLHAYAGDFDSAMRGAAPGSLPAGWEERAAPLRAFWQFLTDAGTLSGDEYDALEVCVEGALGRPCVRHTFLSQLVSGAPAALAAAPTPTVTPPRLPSPPLRVPPPAPPAAVPLSPPERKAGTAGNRQKLTAIDWAAHAPALTDRPAAPPKTAEAAHSPAAPDTAPRVSPPAHTGVEAEQFGAVLTVPELSEELRTFEEFARNYWLDPVTSECEPAPWRQGDYEGRVGAALDAALEAAATGNPGRLAEAYLLAGGCEGSVRPQTVANVAAAFYEPLKLSVGRDAGRVAFLRSGHVSRPELQLGLTLEALRPTPGDTLYEPEFQDLLAKAEFRDGSVAAVVAGLLRHHTQSETEPTARLRAALAKQPPPCVDWAAVLVERRKRVHAEVRRVTQSAGSAYVGQFRHCRLAWAKFMTRFVIPLATPMYPDHAGPWDAAKAATRIGRLSREHAEIADADEARAKARVMMDRVVERLAEAFTEANDAWRELARLPQCDPSNPGDLAGDARLLVDGPRGGTPAEQLAHALLARVLGPGAASPLAAHPLSLEPRHFAAYPALLDFVDEPIDPAAPPRADRLAESGRAAAVLLDPRGRRDGPARWDDIEAQARGDGRYDRLKTLRDNLLPTDLFAAAQKSNELLVAKQRQADRLRAAWRGLEALGVPSHKVNYAAIAWAESDGEGGDLRLQEAWLGRVADASGAQLAAAVASLDATLSRDPSAADRLQDLRAGRYGVALRGRDGAAAEALPPRETAWRGDAARRFLSPRATLLDLADAGRDIARKWTANLGEKGSRHNSLSSLRAEFVRLVFGDTSRSLAGARDQADRGQAVFRLETARVRAHLAAQQPTYLPQLHAAKYLVVVAAPESPADRTYVQRAAEVAAECGENAIVAILCPGITPPVRDELRKKLHSRNLLAASVDDLDLCRLLNPGGLAPDPVVGLLEVVLEQQPWRARNPFVSPEGSDVRLEMYVGRRNEAEQLATTAVKTRLFSGRKLGKTALLQYIRQTWDGEELPNGRVLRVVYVSIVGVDNEALFARRVLEQLRHDFPGVTLPRELPGPASILDCLRQLLEQRRGVELLIVLDEADEFVAAQVRDDATRPGQGLSWKLREALTAGGESGNRVRYVFTGYRATSTRDGVWYNWGDVLELEQLSPDEAAGLVARPLARLGIDAGAEAADIAFRCGYQPAVLLRLGERLVERLDERGYQEGYSVTREDVQEAFEDAKVQAEIQGVVRANFQGNPFGQAVFAVVLRESARAALGQWLPGLAQTVADAFADELDRLEEPGADLAGTVAAQLRDMCSRKLLRARGESRHPEYQMAFPYHLAVLLDNVDLATEVRVNLRAWRETRGGPGGARAAHAGEGRSPLRRSDLAMLRDALGGTAVGAAPPVIVVASPWPAALSHEPGGVPDRLGLPDPPLPAAGYRADSESRCWKAATPADMARVLAQPPAHGPVVLLGGIDLLRAAFAHADRDGSAVEAVGPYRMSDGQVRWWFQRVLGVEFESEEVYVRVHGATGGVPQFVGEFTTLLLPGGAAGGLNASAELAEGALRKLADRLADPGYAARVGAELTARERDLLRMAHAVGVAYEVTRARLGDLLGQWAAADFGPAWASLFPGRPFPAHYLAHGEDSVALETLLAAGLLPSADAPGGSAVGQALTLDRGDPVAALLANLG